MFACALKTATLPTLVRNKILVLGILVPFTPHTIVVISRKCILSYTFPISSEELKLPHTYFIKLIEIVPTLLISLLV